MDTEELERDWLGVPTATDTELITHAAQLNGEAVQSLRNRMYSFEEIVALTGRTGEELESARRAFRASRK